MKKIKALGVMNGTSLDGIDYALIEVSPDLKKIQYKKHWSKSIPKGLKNKLLQAATNKATTYEVSQLHFELGQLYGQHIKQIKSKHKFDLVGLHGQTIHHEGKKTSFQIGHPGYTAKVSDTPVYFDFRSNDIINGGQGAPFAPFFQKHIAPNSKEPFAFHNLGGISNLTLFKGKQVLGFDTGPANILIDAWMKYKTNKDFDRLGKTASQGLPDPKLVNKFLKYSYFNKAAPKSSGREEFNLNFIVKQGGASFKKLSFNDQMATLVEVTAQSIGDAYNKLKTKPKIVYFYGGGVFNSYLMDRLHYHLFDMEIKTTDDLGWPSQSFEASIFAFLATARHLNKKVHIPQVTGAKSAVHLGAIYTSPI